jgi:hypothetical protein
MFLGSRQGFCGLIGGLGRRFVRGFAAYFVSKKKWVGGEKQGPGIREQGSERQGLRDLGNRKAAVSRYTSLARLAVRALLGAGSRSLGRDEFSSGSLSCKTALSSDL